MSTDAPFGAIVTVPAVLLAVTAAEVDRSQIASRIRSMFPYRWLKTADVRQVGHNYAIYERGRERELLLRAGFPVSGPFAETQEVQCFELAAGQAAHALHVGPYAELARTYAGLDAWCKEQGLRLSGQAWELYGDWHEDPSQLQTGVYYRLAECAAL
jgi:effector-binding domain-containing protein